MSTLKTTINIASTDLFPTPVNFTFPVTETIGGAHSSFNTKVLPAAATNVVLFSSTAASGSTGILYFCIQASADNLDTISVDIRRNTGPVTADMMLFAPGDIAYFPVDASDAAGIIIRATNNASASIAALQYFYGEKG